MPVSPQDFELYSRMTGVPMPSDAMSRMQMAPEVYKFTKDFARKPNILEKTGNLVKTLGTMGLRGIGEGYKQSQANEQRALQEQLRNQADIMQSEAVTMDDPVEEISEKLQIEQEKTRRKQIEVTGRLDLEKMRMTGQPSTTAGNYGQNVVINSTAQNIIDKKMEQGSQMADSVPNIAEVLSTSEESQPASLYGTNPLNVPRLQSEDVGTMASPEFIAEFRKKRNLDKALKGVFALGQQEEELVDDSAIVQFDSPLNDHPDVKDVSGGEEPNPRMGINTSSTENLNQRRNEVENMIRRGAATLSPKQQEDVIGKMISPGDRQVNLLKEREMANEEAIASGFMNLDDEGRRRESIRMGSIGGIPNKTDMQEIRKDPEYIAAQESMLPKTTLEKADQLTTKIMPNKRSSFVESMNLDLSADKAPTATFNLNDNTGGTNPYSVEISTPMAVSLNEMVEDNSLPKESFGKLFNLAKKSIKDKTGMAYGIDQ